MSDSPVLLVQAKGPTQPLELTNCHVDVCANGWTVTLERDPPLDQHVFTRFDDLVAFLFFNLVKPPALPKATVN